MISIQRLLETHVLGPQNSKEVHYQLLKLNVVEDRSVIFFQKNKLESLVVYYFLDSLDVELVVGVFDFEAKLEILVVKDSDVGLRIIVKSFDDSSRIKKIGLKEGRKMWSEGEEVCRVLTLKFLKISHGGLINKYVMMDHSLTNKLLSLINQALHLILMTHLDSPLASLQASPELKTPFNTSSKPSDSENLSHHISNLQPEQASSLQALGSNLCSVRKLSAFSLYNPESSNEECSIADSPEQGQRQMENEQESEPKIKRTTSKREQYRLETKNLNRFFRSKINEMLRDIKENSRDELELGKANELLGKLNSSNKIMFSEMREVIKDEWLQAKLQKCTAMLMRYVHKGKMGMHSKLIMLKYFNKILKAIRNPDKFTCWK